MRLWQDMIDWLCGCPLWHRISYLRRGQRLDSVDSGIVHYGITMAFAKGTTLQDLLAAGAATTAIWVARHPDCAGHIDEVEVDVGRYQVDTEIRVRFHPIPDGQDVVPIFDGRKLVEILENTQR